MVQCIRIAWCNGRYLEGSMSYMGYFRLHIAPKFRGAFERHKEEHRGYRG
jgi:hypothetical protein